MQPPAQTQAPQDGYAGDEPSYAKAVLNILEDYSEERSRQIDSHRAVLNILDDFDIEKRKVEAANRRLEERTAELGRSNEELERFAYAASHDLQEPLRMITSYTQLIARRYRGRLDSDADEFIDFVVDGATRMSALIRDVLDFSRVGSSPPELTWTACEQVLERALANLRGVVGETGALVTHGPLPTVLADAAQFVQLFQNLIDNGVKFCLEKPPRVHIAAQPADGGWTFTFRDNGIGVSSAHHARIFQVFQQLHSRAYPGTGIGLATCKKIVDRHGGHLWVECDPGSGSTFSFTLPDRPTAPVAPPGPAARDTA